MPDVTPILLATLTLGLFSGLHCAGMCGPLLMAIPRLHGSSPIRSNLLHHAGRLAVYAGLGAVAGALGWSVRFAGLQNLLSIGLGIVLLAGLAGARLTPISAGVGRAVLELKRRMGPRLRSDHPGATVILGALNGLLPCGMVYVAAATAATSGSAVHGALAMLAFGIGTSPILLAMGLGRSAFPSLTRLQVQRLLPFTVGVVAILLILRGSGLGIPYVSPAPPTVVGSAHCH